MSVIELQDVSFRYGGGTDASISGAVETDGSTTVLRKISLSIAPGELVAIQGPSGSGKSTFLYIMGCLLRPSSGRVLIDGRDTAGLDDEALAILRNQTIGFVFQQFHLLPRTSVLENILLPTLYPVEFASVSEDDRSRARTLAETLGLGERLDHAPNQLSGGQQQRVAIARALMRDTRLILADEPTGNLDSRTSEQTMELLKELHRQGRTVVIITHDPEIARQCPRILHIRDGRLTGESRGDRVAPSPSVSSNQSSTEIEDTDTDTARAAAVDAQVGMGDTRFALMASERGAGIRATLRARIAGYLAMAFKLSPQAFENLRRNKTRSALTMLGITIGVAAVLAMVTLGQFTKERILESYAELGVNTITFYGDPNWQLKATDIVPVVYRSFDMARDIEPLYQVFPQIRRMSPVLVAWQGAATFAGRSVDQDVRIKGVNEHALPISDYDVLVGRNFSKHHLENRASVCIIGYEIGTRLFSQTAPIDKVLYITMNESTFSCRVIGVLQSRTTNQEWNKPNLQVLLPYTYFQAVANNYWSSQIFDVLIELRDGSDIEATGKSIETFFTRKYGKSGRFRVSSDSKLIGQMKRFLNLFTVMLGSIALTCLAVGGIGITNMMLVSVTERIKEIGLRKALGATDLSVRVQFLVESVILCMTAGFIGLVAGFAAYEGVIWGASKFVPTLKFEWLFEPGAVALSLVSIVIVGIASGLLPALRAEKLQVIEALRSE